MNKTQRYAALLAGLVVLSATCSMVSSNGTRSVVLSVIAGVFGVTALVVAYLMIRSMAPTVPDAQGDG